MSQFRLKTGLQWSSIETRFGNAWVVSDPVTSSIIRLSSEERDLLLLLDGSSSVEIALQQFSRKYPSIDYPESDVHRLMQLFRSRSMARTTRQTIPPAQSMDVAAAIAATPWKLMFGRVSLFNPNRLVSALASQLKSIEFRPIAISLACLAAVTTLLVVARWPEFVHNLPSFELLLSPRSMMGFGVAFVLTRVLHEVGHAVVCARLGARVSDTGIIFMMGIVCPYVDVSDSQRLRKRWQRAAVAGAGVIVEIVLAALAVIVWWLTAEGPLHWFAFQIAIVCGISTVVFNANPLMRYDGYFVLSDLVDVPNLREKSAAAHRTFWSRFVFGARTPQSRDRSGWLCAFGLATSIYRSLLLFGIACLIIQISVSWHVTWLGIVVVSLLAISSIVVPLWKAVGWSFNEVRNGRLKPARTAGAWILLIVLVAVSLSMPIPQRVSFLGRVATENMQPIYAANAGIMSRTNESGVITLSSYSAEQYLDLAEARMKQSQFRAAVEQTERAALFDNEALEKIATAKSRLDWSTDNVVRRIDEIRRSELVKYRESDGKFISAVIGTTPESLSKQFAADSGVATTTNQAIENWSDTTAAGRFVDEGALIGWRILDQTKRVEVTVKENDLPWLHVGYEANVSFSQLPYSVFKGRVASVSLQRDVNDNESDEREYKAEIELVGPDVPELVVGGTASVVVKSEKRPLISIARDWFSRNFRLR